MRCPSGIDMYEGLLIDLSHVATRRTHTGLELLEVHHQQVVPSEVVPAALVHVLSGWQKQP